MAEVGVAHLLSASNAEASPIQTDDEMGKIDRKIMIPPTNEAWEKLGYHFMLFSRLPENQLVVNLSLDNKNNIYELTLFEDGTIQYQINKNGKNCTINSNLKQRQGCCTIF